MKSINNVDEISMGFISTIPSHTSRHLSNGFIVGCTEATDSYHKTWDIHSFSYGLDGCSNNELLFHFKLLFDFAVVFSSNHHI